VPEKNSGENAAVGEQGVVINETYDWLEALTYAVVAVILIFSFVFRTAGVDGSSMETTMHDGDRVVISDLFYKPAAGDIVVVNSPNFTGRPLIKRVIATGGQYVEIVDGIVYVDGEALDEPYASEPVNEGNEGDITPLTVPEGELFVMGDNRNASTDSRFSAVGTVDERYVMGRVLMRILPISSIGTVK